MKKYDVFISSKSEDYPIAEEVYEFLNKNGLTVFLASKELECIGESEYANAIDAALDAASHLVVITSSIEHVKSRWVSYEWGTFRNDINSGYRVGNLLTVIGPGISLKDLPPGLRHQQSFSFSTYQQTILGYLKREDVSDSSEQSFSADNTYKKAKAEYAALNYIEAFNLFRLLAEQGHVKAQYKLASMFTKGQGTERNDVEAFSWFYRAAKQNDKDAQYRVGILFEKGMGVTQDKSAAIKWIRKAAEQGLAIAQHNLATKFYYGNIVRRNYQAAYNWLKKAADQGYVESQIMLGNMFEYGMGIELDYKTSAYWYEKAAMQGDKYAQSRIIDLKNTHLI